MMFENDSTQVENLINSELPCLEYDGSLVNEIKNYIKRGIYKVQVITKEGNNTSHFGVKFSLSCLNLKFLKCII